MPLNHFVEILNIELGQCCSLSSCACKWTLVVENASVILWPSKMEILCITSLKMTLLLLYLFVLVQSTRATGSPLLKHGLACGRYHVSHLGDPSHALFFIDGELVDRYVFCKTLKDYNERSCFLEIKVENQFCGLDISLGMCYQVSYWLSLLSLALTEN